MKSSNGTDGQKMNGGRMNRPDGKNSDTVVFVEVVSLHLDFTKKVIFVKFDRILLHNIFWCFESSLLTK